jgi:glycosyltransferase involved in cell wall biosynthesis
MNVLMLTSTLPRFAGDMQANFVCEQAEAWLGARPDDEITILAPGDAKGLPSERRGRLAIERFRYFVPSRLQRLAYPAILPNITNTPLLALQLPGFLLAQYRAACRLIAKRKIQLVYAHWVMPQGLVAWLLWRRFGVPFILQNHSSDLAVFDRLGRVGRKLAATLLRDCVRFFCVNTAQLDYARSLLPPGVRAEFDARASCLPMGIAQAEDPPGNGGDAFDLATIGRLSRKKGLYYLIAAAEELASRGIRPRIGIAGDGEDRAELQAMVQASDVEFVGFVAGPDKDAFLASSRRFAFPAKSSGGDVEGLPVALLEAFGRGKPVLASRDTNIELLPEWSRLRDLVVLVSDPADIQELANALQRLLDTDRSRTIATVSIVERYLWKNLIHEYLELIRIAAEAR